MIASALFCDTATRKSVFSPIHLGQVLFDRRRFVFFEGTLEKKDWTVVFVGLPDKQKEDLAVMESCSHIVQSNECFLIVFVLLLSNLAGELR